jgi:hypothetical protein
LEQNVETIFSFNSTANVGEEKELYSSICFDEISIENNSNSTTSVFMYETYLFLLKFYHREDQCTYCNVYSDLIYHSRENFFQKML